MYILVDSVTNKIVGTAMNAVSESSCAKNNQIVFEIDDSEFKIEMIGSILNNYAIKNSGRP